MVNPTTVIKIKKVKNPQVEQGQELPPGYENLTLDQIRERFDRLGQTVSDRIGREVEVSPLIRGDELSLIDASENSITTTESSIISAREEASEIAPTVIRIDNNLDSIINPQSYAEWIISLYTKFQDLPIVWKILIAGGLIITIASGGYVAYKVINRTKIPKTIVTPFGARMTTAGRVIRAIMYKD